MYRIILLLIFSTSLQAQNPFDIKPNPSIGFWEGTSNFFNADAFITNDTDSTIIFSWERILEDIPDTWESSICTNLTCLPPEVSSGEFSVDPGYSVDLDCTFYPHHNPGSGQVEVKVWINNDTTHSITQVFFGNANTTNTIDTDLENQYSLFPNPTSSIFSLEGNKNYEQVEIFNLQGLMVAKFERQPHYNLRHLPTNLYFVHVLSEQKEVLTVLKIKKE